MEAMEGTNEWRNPFRFLNDGFPSGIEGSRTLKAFQLTDVLATVARRNLHSNCRFAERRLNPTPL